jgi:hypothetical protein
MSAPPPPMPTTLNDPHPIHLHAVRTLAKAGGLITNAIDVHPAIKLDDVRYALSRIGTGLDHTIGEEALAFSECSLDKKREPYAVYFLATDRRILGTVGYASGKIADVRYSQIEQLHKKQGILTVELRARVGQSWHDLAFGEHFEELTKFLEPMIAVPPEHREPTPSPLCVPTDSDPTGAGAALARMPYPSVRTQMLLTYVRDRGLPPAIAQDLVARLVLAYRNRFFGRGAHQGRYMSPASADDLSTAMVQMFGAPHHHAEHPVRTLVLPSLMRDDTGAAIAESAVGLTVLAVTGLGWTRRARPSVPSFAFMVANTGSFASYRLMLGNGQRGLESAVPMLVDDIHYNLMSIEEAFLLRRCIYGWSVPSHELSKAAPADVLAELTKVVGPIDPRVLAS